MALEDLLVKTGSQPTLFNRYQERERQFGLDQLAQQETQQAMQLRNLKMQQAQQQLQEADVMQQVEQKRRQRWQEWAAKTKAALESGNQEQYAKQLQMGIADANAEGDSQRAFALQKQLEGLQPDQPETSKEYNDWLAQGGQKGTGMSFIEYKTVSGQAGQKPDLTMPPSVSGASVKADISNYATENLEEDSIPAYHSAVKDLSESLLSELRNKGYNKAITPKQAIDWAEQQAKQYVGKDTGMFGGLLPDIGDKEFNATLFEDEKGRLLEKQIIMMTAPRPKTPEEAAELAPGTTFIDPQGNIRVR